MMPRSCKSNCQVMLYSQLANRLDVMKILQANSRLKLRTLIRKYSIMNSFTKLTRVISDVILATLHCTVALKKSEMTVNLVCSVKCEVSAIRKFEQTYKRLLDCDPALGHGGAATATIFFFFRHFLQSGAREL